MRQNETVIPIAIRKLKRLTLRLPPSHLFDKPLGCRGDNRFFALWWSRTDQAPVLNDSGLKYTGTAAPYRIWRYHPKVIAALAKYNIGDAAITADHWLLVDRKSRALYAGKIWDVLIVLDSRKIEADRPTNETGAGSGPSDPREPQGDNEVKTDQRDDQPLRSSQKLLDDLQAWLDANMSGN